MAPVPAILIRAPVHVREDLGHDVLMETLPGDALAAVVVPPILKTATHLVRARKVSGFKAVQGFEATQGVRRFKGWGDPGVGRFRGRAEVELTPILLKRRSQLVIASLSSSQALVMTAPCQKIVWSSPMKKTYAVASFRARADSLKVWSVDANSPANG